MHVGILTVFIQLPGCASLKEKRSRLKPLLARLRREFNISVAEIDRQDVWQEAVIACALVSNAEGQIQRTLQAVVDWIENNWPDISLTDDQKEII
jgi:uncharacterized protein